MQGALTVFPLWHTFPVDLQGFAVTSVRRLRDRLGWSQEEMAAWVRTNQGHISKLERGLIPLTGPVSRCIEELEGHVAAGRIVPKVKEQRRAA